MSKFLIETLELCTNELGEEEVYGVVHRDLDDGQRKYFKCAPDIKLIEYSLKRIADEFNAEETPLLRPDNS